MAVRRISVEKLIQRQRIRRRISSGAPRRPGTYLSLIARISGILVGLALTALIGFLAYRFIFSGYFELKKMVVTGVSDGIAAEISALTKLEPNQGINLLFLKERSVRDSVLKHPRIQSAKVLKCYPNALMIEAHERQPVAIVPCGALYLIDRDGYVLDTLGNFDRQQNQFPFITGVNPDQIVLGQPISTKAVCRALDLFECVREVSPSVARALSEIRVGRDEGLTLILSGGVEIWFGTGEFADRLAALDLFARKYHDLESLEYVDLRFENQIVYRPHGGQGSANASVTGRPWSANRTRREL